MSGVATLGLLCSAVRFRRLCQQCCALCHAQMLLASRQGAQLPGRQRVKAEQCASLVAAAGFSLLWTVGCWAVTGRGMLHHALSSHWWTSSGVGFLLQATGCLGLALVQAQGAGSALVQSPGAAMQQGTAGVAASLLVDLLGGGLHEPRLGALLLAGAAAEAACWARWRGRMRAESMLPGGLSSLRGAAAHVKVRRPGPPSPRTHCGVSSYSRH